MLEIANTEDKALKITLNTVLVCTMHSVLSAAITCQATRKRQEGVVCTGSAGEGDAGLATPLEVYQGVAADGYQVSYRRVPLSRERTPEAADLDVLHQQLMTQPVGRSSVICTVAV